MAGAMSGRLGVIIYKLQYVNCPCTVRGRKGDLDPYELLCSLRVGLVDRFGYEVLGIKAGALWPDLLITRAAGDEVVRAQSRPTTTHRASEAEMRHFVDLITKGVEPVSYLEALRRTDPNDQGIV